jgi:hypothetical protein
VLHESTKKCCAVRRPGASTFFALPSCLKIAIYNLIAILIAFNALFGHHGAVPLALVAVLSAPNAFTMLSSTADATRALQRKRSTFTTALCAHGFSGDGSTCEPDPAKAIFLVAGEHTLLAATGQQGNHGEVDVPSVKAKGLLLRQSVRACADASSGAQLNCCNTRFNSGELKFSESSHAHTHSCARTRLCLQRSCFLVTCVPAARARAWPQPEAPCTLRAENAPLHARAALTQE